MRALRKAVSSPAVGDPERDLSYEIAEQVFDLRTEQELTQGQLAERAGTKQPAISGVESATKLPTLGLLLRIAAALNRRLVIRFEPRKGEE
jgi:transcriptional regulator with XRE-family HTH domain